MAVTKKNMKEIILEFVDFGTIISFSLEQIQNEKEKESFMSKLENIFISENFEMAKWYLNDVLSSFGYQDETKSFDYYQQRFTKVICFHELVPNYERELSNTEIDCFLNDEYYQRTMNIYYTKRIIKQLTTKKQSKKIQTQLDYYYNLLVEFEKNIQKDMDNYCHQSLVEQKVG